MDTSQSRMSRYTDFILKYRWLVITLTLAFTAFSFQGFQKFAFNGQYRIFFSEENPQLKAFDEIQRTYTKDDSILMVVAPENGDVFTRENLAIVKKLTDDAWQIPYSTRVDSLSNFQWTRSDKELEAEGEDGILVTDLVDDASSLSDAEITHLKKVAINEVVLRDRLVSPNARVTAVNIKVELPGYGVGLQSMKKGYTINKGENRLEFSWRRLSLKPETIKLQLPVGITLVNTELISEEKKLIWIVQSDRNSEEKFEVQFSGLEENADATNYAIKLAESYEKQYPGIKIYLTGMSMMNDAFSKSSMSDMSTLNPLMYLVILVIMGLLLRSISGTFVTMTVIFLSTAITIGLFFICGYEMTGPTTSAPTMILTLAVADSIHILLTMLSLMRQGYEKRQAIREAMRVNVGPVFLTSFTTAIGFLCMNFSDAPPYKHLGNLTAFGVVLAFVLSVTFLPALVSILPFKIKRVDEEKHSPFMARFADWVIAQRRLLMSCAILMTMGLGYAITRNDLNDQFVKYFSENVKFRRDTDYTMKHLSGIYQLEFNIHAAGEQGIQDPAYLKKLEEFSNAYQSLTDVVHVNSVSDVFKKINRSMHQDKAEKYTLPESRELASQYLMLYEFSLPQGFDLNNQINNKRSATRFVVTLKNVTSRRTRELAAWGEEWLKTNTPEHMHAMAASPGVMFAHISKRNVNSMLFGSLWALLFISFCLMFALKSFKYGLMSLVPNFLPAIFAFGIWGLTVGQIGLALSGVVSMTLGIVVDDTVHFLSKYIRARREQNLSSEDAVRYAFKSVGKALVVTSLVLVSGFLVMTLSDFNMNADMGWLTSITICMALMADLLFLPPLLITFDKLLIKKEVPSNETVTA